MAGEWLFGARLGRGKRALLQKLQVSEVTQGQAPSEVMFEFMPLTSAPGSGPRQDSNLRSRLRGPMLYDVPTWRNALFRVRLGSVWGAQDANCWTRMQPHLRPASARRARIVVSSVVECSHGAVNSQQHDDADLLAAAAEDFLVYP